VKRVEFIFQALRLIYICELPLVKLKQKRQLIYLPWLLGY